MAVPELAEALNVDTPEALIRRRPDVRAVEAEIGSLLSLGEAERARLFPTITFNADVFALLNETNDLGDSFGFGLGPAIRWEGPDLRRVRADITIADARTQAAFARYEDTVITALGEVEVALAEYVQAYVQRGDLEAAARSAARAEELARVRFSEGVDDFLDVIDAQRTLLAAEDRLEQNRIETTKRAITTYRALGGVWLNEASEQVAETQE
jgi:multidrug efflux system outer membrane protein